MHWYARHMKDSNPKPMSDGQGVQVFMNFPQALLEELARAIPAADMAEGMLYAAQKDQKLMSLLLTTLIKGLSNPELKRERKAFMKLIQE